MNNPEEYYHSKRFKALLKEFEDNERNGIPNIISAEDYIDVAEFYYNNGSVEHALQVIDTAMRLYPGDATPLLFKSRIELIDNNDPEKAIYYAEQISDKTDLEYYYIRAEILLAQGLAFDADNYLEDCYATLDDEDRQYFEIDASTLFLDYEFLDNAEKWFDRCSNKEIIEYKELKARINMTFGEFETSKKLYQELIDQNPYSTQYWNALASSQFFSNDIEESINSSEYSIAIDPDNALALLNKANGLYNLGNYNEALEYYTRYNKLCPEDDNGVMLIGLCYLLLEDFGNAIPLLQKALDMTSEDAPNRFDIYKDLAYALCRQNRVDEAMDILDKADKFDCDHNELLVYRGSLLLGCGKGNEAKDCFIKALAKSKCKPEIFLKISITFYESGDANLAYKMFKVFYKNVKGLEKGYAYFAACCYDLGKYSEFLKYLKLAIKYTPNETREILGELFPENTKPEDYYEYISQKLKK